MQGKQEGKEKEGVKGKKKYNEKDRIEGEKTKNATHIYNLQKSNQKKKNTIKFQQTKAKNYKQPLSFKYVTSKLNKNSRTKVF